MDASSDYDEILGDDFQDEEQVEEEKNCKEKCFGFLGQVVFTIIAISSH